MKFLVNVGTLSTFIWTGQVSLGEIWQERFHGQSAPESSRNFSKHRLIGGLLPEVQGQAETECTTQDEWSWEKSWQLSDWVSAHPRQLGRLGNTSQERAKTDRVELSRALGSFRGRM